MPSIIHPIKRTLIRGRFIRCRRRERRVIKGLATGLKAVTLTFNSPERVLKAYFPDRTTHIFYTF